MNRHRIEISVILAAVMIILWYRHGSKINEWMIIWNLDTVAPVELLIQKFELTVFRNDFEDKDYKDELLLTRWKYPIRMRLHGEEPKRFRVHIQQTLNILSQLSGLNIHLNEGIKPEWANMDFYIAPPNRVAPILLLYDNEMDAIARLADANCLGIATYIQSIGRHDVTIIKNTLGDKKIRHCIIEEIIQGLGLVADSDILQPSIMSESAANIDRLPMNDKIMFRTLYDKRLKPGMTREEAMPIVAKIIPELVAAVKERGEEALYQ